MIKMDKKYWLLGAMINVLWLASCSKESPNALTEYIRKYEPVSVLVEHGQSAVIRNSNAVLVVVPEKTESRTFRQDAFLAEVPFDGENLQLVHSSTNRDSTVFDVHGFEFRVSPLVSGYKVSLGSYTNTEHLAVFDSTNVSALSLESLSYKTNSPPTKEDYDELKKVYGDRLESL